jgi:hypothetical protein
MGTFNEFLKQQHPEYLEEGWNPFRSQTPTGWTPEDEQAARKMVQDSMGTVTYKQAVQQVQQGKQQQGNWNKANVGQSLLSRPEVQVRMGGQPDETTPAGSVKLRTSMLGQHPSHRGY